MDVKLTLELLSTSVEPNTQNTQKCKTKGRP